MKRFKTLLFVIDNVALLVLTALTSSLYVFNLPTWCYVIATLVLLVTLTKFALHMKNHQLTEEDLAKVKRFALNAMT